jgi:diguanylate cyclase (GGDEF)-like protein
MPHTSFDPDFFHLLTQTYNRRKLKEILQREIERSNRYETSLCVALFDIDNFKNINDTYGHNVGDEVLRYLAKIVKNAIRVNDTFGRWGGEEFLLILPNVSLEEAKIACEKIRFIITQTEFETIGSITCSFGLCAYSATSNFDTLISQCDHAMYKAKSAGKNCVNVFVSK